MDAKIVAKDATAPVACCSVNNMRTQTCQYSEPQENGVLVDDDQDCLARLVDMKHKFQELQLKVMADVELKLQEHAAHLRMLLVEEVASQIRNAAKPSAADAEDTAPPVTRATFCAVGQVHEEGCVELANLRGLGSPNYGLSSPSHRGLREDAGVSELHREAPDPRAETRRRLSAIEQQLRSREREAMIPGVIGNVERLHSTALVATSATGRNHATEREVVTIDHPCPWQQKQDQSVYNCLESTFLGTDKADAKGCSEETRAPSLSPAPPSNRPREAVEHSSYTSSSGSRSPKQRQTCTQRYASPELADILERRRFISEGQISQQAYGAFMSPRAKRKS